MDYLFSEQEPPRNFGRSGSSNLLFLNQENPSGQTAAASSNFSVSSFSPSNEVTTPLYVGIAIASGGGISASPADSSVAGSSQQSSSQSYSYSPPLVFTEEASFADTAGSVSAQSSSWVTAPLFSYATLSVEGNGSDAYTNYNTNSNSTPTVLVDTAYVFQNGDYAWIRADIDGYIGWYEGYEWSIEILDPGDYWSVTFWSDGVFGCTDSMYDGWWFTWQKPEGLENNDPNIDRDFTFRFTVDTQYLDLGVHIAWAEVQVDFAGHGNYRHTDRNDGQSANNTVVVGQKVAATFDIDPAVTLTSITWATPSGGSFVKDYITTGSTGTIVNHTAPDYHAEEFVFYYTNKNTNSTIIPKVQS